MNNDLFKEAQDSKNDCGLLAALLQTIEEVGVSKLQSGNCKCSLSVKTHLWSKGRNDRSWNVLLAHSIPNVISICQLALFVLRTPTSLRPELCLTAVESLGQSLE